MPRRATPPPIQLADPLAPLETVGPLVSACQLRSTLIAGPKRGDASIKFIRLAALERMRPEYSPLNPSLSLHSRTQHLPAWRTSNASAPAGSVRAGRHQASASSDRRRLSGRQIHVTLLQTRARAERAGARRAWLRKRRTWSAARWSGVNRIRKARRANTHSKRLPFETANID